MPIILSRMIGIYIAITGAVFLIKPKSLRGYVGFWKKSMRLYFIGGSRIVMGYILLWAHPLCRMQAVVLALGALLIIAGVPYFALRPEKLKIMFSRWQNRSTASARILGLCILAAGVLLFFSI